MCACICLVANTVAVKKASVKGDGRQLKGIAKTKFAALVMRYAHMHRHTHTCFAYVPMPQSLGALNMKLIKHKQRMSASFSCN
jgi:hypothetical protein